MTDLCVLLSCLQDIFMFITRQLKGLEDTKSAQFNRYFYLLEVCDCVWKGWGLIESRVE